MPPTQITGAEAPVRAEPSGFAAAHADLLNDRDLQFSMTPIEMPDPPQWLEPLLRSLQVIGPFMVWVFWIGVACIVLLLLYVIGSEILRRLPDRRAKQNNTDVPAPVQYKPAQARARALLEEADRLAADGKYSEAVRVLLHRSIEDIERGFTVAIGPDLTSREIAALPPLSNEGRNVFVRIARAVETSLFGGRPLSGDEFAACRQAYASFALGRAAS